MRNAYKILVGNPERKRTFGRSAHRWDDNSRVVHKEIGYEDVNWFHLPQDRFQ
jgi:hypothetical protein